MGGGGPEHVLILQKRLQARSPHLPRIHISLGVATCRCGIQSCSIQGADLALGTSVADFCYTTWTVDIVQFA